MANLISILIRFFFPQLIYDHTGKGLFTDLTSRNLLAGATAITIGFLAYLLWANFVGAPLYSALLSSVGICLLVFIFHLFRPLMILKAGHPDFTIASSHIKRGALNWAVLFPFFLFLGMKLNEPLFGAYFYGCLGFPTCIHLLIAYGVPKK